jgi:hypothetical protein
MLVILMPIAQAPAAPRATKRQPAATSEGWPAPDELDQALHDARRRAAEAGLAFNMRGDGCRYFSSPIAPRRKEGSD